MKTFANSLLVVLSILAFTTGFAKFSAANAAVNPVKAEEFQLDSFQGKVVLMDFWASWCKPCQKSMPWLADLQATYGPEGLQVVAVNLDQDWDAAVEMASSLPPEVVLVHDPEGILADQRNLQGMPSTYLYGRDSRLKMVHVGFLVSETAAKEAEIKNLLAGKGDDFDAASLGTGVAGVQPWQRDLLAAPGMEIDPDPIETALNEHVYFSKEASSGGIGSAGGGCGCN